METNEIIQERKKTHGSWVEQANTSHCLKNQMRSCSGWHSLKPYQQEALDMIEMKVSRILSGDPNEPDHWDDIAGYALLGKKGHD